MAKMSGLARLLGAVGNQRAINGAGAAMAQEAAMGGNDGGDPRDYLLSLGQDGVMDWESLATAAIKALSFEEAEAVVRMNGFDEMQ